MKPSVPIPKQGFKIAEAAEYLGCRPISIRRLIRRGLLRPSRVLRHPIIPRQQLDELLAEGESSARA